MNDFEAYSLYTRDNVWYDKLYLAQRLGYSAGGGPIPNDGKFVIKPRINLRGCSIGAKIGYFKKNDPIPQEHFWSEVFTGRHITVDYSKIDGRWCQGHTFEGFRDNQEDLLKFSLWRRVEYTYVLPNMFDEIQVDNLNIEIIGDKIIEIHLRHNTDPVDHDCFIPIWSDKQQCPPGHVRIDDREDHPGRLGFFIREDYEQRTIQPKNKNRLFDT